VSAREPDTAGGEDGAATRRRAFIDGARAVTVVLPGVLPFATVAGATAVDAGLSVSAAMAMSLLIFAGSAQLVLIQLFDAGAALVTMLLTALVINLRFAMYSAGLAPLFHGATLRQRLLMGYVLSDQAFAICTARFDARMGAAQRVAFFFGISLPMWIVWECGTLAGALLGRAVPPEWSLDFAVPLMFLGLLLLGLRSPAQRVAALVAAVVAVLGRDWAYNSGLLIGALAGVLCGWLAQRLLRSRSRSRPGAGR